MASLQEIMQVCRLCLVSDQVNVPIFDGTSDIRETFAKISSCLPVKVSKDDNLPKKICEGCSYKLDLLYDFRNTSVSSEKQLLQWLQQIGVSSGIPTTAVSSGPNATTQTNSDILVKQESFEHNEGAAAATAGGMSAEAQSYIMQQQKLPYRQEFPGFGESSTSTSEPPPKRARRAAAMKAPIAPETDSDEDDLDNDMTITKAESDDDSDEPDQPSYVDATSTSVDDQPGPSGVGKPSVEAAAINVGKEAHQKPEILRVYTNKRKVKSAISERNCLRKSLNLWMCRKCFQEFSSPAEVNEHLQVHDEEEKPKLDSSHLDERTPTPQGCLSQRAEFDWSQDFAWTRITGAKQYAVECTTCSAKFQDKSLFRKHFEDIHSELSLCYECNKKFTTNDEYHCHLGNHVNHCDEERQNKTFTCYICRSEFKQQSLFENHMLGHNVCILCNYRQFKSYDSLRLHQRRTHSKNEKRITVGRSIDGIDNIQENCTPEASKVRERSDRVPDALAWTTDIEQKIFTCTTCSSEFQDKFLFHEHLTDSHGDRFVCYECNKKFSTTDHFSSHMKTHSNYCQPADVGNAEKPKKKNFCTICNDQFENHISLYNHWYGHFECVVCGKQYPSLSLLRSHQRHAHTVDTFRPETCLCEVCGECLKRGKLKRHYRKHTRSGQKAFICALCDKKYSEKKQLDVHVRNHTGEKPFCCEHCGERFSRYTSFTNHVKRHTGERPFGCALCGKGFITKQARNYHQGNCTNTS